MRTRALLLLTTLAACASPVEQDVTLRLTRDREVVHASGTITEDPDTGRPSLVARFALDAGKTGVLLIHSDPPTVGLYEEWRGERRLFAAEVIDPSFVGRLTEARVGARIEFAFTAHDAASDTSVQIRGAATVVEVRGARPSNTSGGVVVVVEDEPDTYDSYDEPSGCESYEPEPEPEPVPDEGDDEWDSADGGGCGGIEGDTVEDDWDEEQEYDGEEWETDEDYESDDDSASGCEGDTYDSSSSALEARRTRRMVRGAWLMLWPLGVITLFNRWARRRC